MRRPAAFARWFAGHALTVPAIGILTLNSGICGDKMVYLSMYAQGDTLRGVGLSDDAAEAEAELRRTRDASGTVTTFSAQSRFHEGLLTLAGSHAGNRSQFWRGVMAVANS